MSKIIIPSWNVVSDPVFETEPSFQYTGEYQNDSLYAKIVYKSYIKVSVSFDHPVGAPDLQFLYGTDCEKAAHLVDFYHDSSCGCYKLVYSVDFDTSKVDHNSDLVLFPDLPVPFADVILDWCKPSKIYRIKDGFYCPINGIWNGPFTGTNLFDSSGKVVGYLKKIKESTVWQFLVKKFSLFILNDYCKLYDFPSLYNETQIKAKSNENPYLPQHYYEKYPSGQGSWSFSSPSYTGNFYDAYVDGLKSSLSESKKKNHASDWKSFSKEFPVNFSVKDAHFDTDLYSSVMDDLKEKLKNSKQDKKTDHIKTEKSSKDEVDNSVDKMLINEIIDEADDDTLVSSDDVGMFYKKNDAIHTYHMYRGNKVLCTNWNVKKQYVKLSGNDILVVKKHFTDYICKKCLEKQHELAV